jgi:N6-L-threonylcarbamoyladenine synthase
MHRLIFAIETSCDETAASLVLNGTKEVASSVASSSELHEKTGGIVPEVAARKQAEYIVPIINETLQKGAEELSLDQNELIHQIDGVAVTVGPGLIGSLVVGVEAAKALCLAWNKPLLPVNHLVGHIYANFLVNDPSEIKFPALALIVSGGHTDLVLMHGYGNLEFLGGTLDDAAGEAFDKTARLLGLSKYKLGGPKISEAAAKCKDNTLSGRLPRPMLTKEGYDFSFSGLKTAVKYLFEREDPPVEVVSCEFETAVVDVLVGKVVKAAQEFDVKSILLGGGVVANTQLRTRVTNASDKLDVPVFIPPLSLCGDTAGYIGSAAYFDSKVVNVCDFDQVRADPSLGVVDLF